MTTRRRAVRAARALAGAVAATLVVTACVPVDPSSAEEAADYSEANGGQVLLVDQLGSKVLERSIPGWSTHDPHRLASGTKSFAGVLAIAATEDGLLTLDERAADTLTEWQADPRRSQITVRQLVGQTSGLDPDAGWPGPDSRAAAVAAPALFPPGARFDYGPNHFHAFAALLERKLAAAGLGGDFLDYLQARVLDPIGLSVAGWNRDGAGHPLLAAGARLAADEWVKLGRLIAQRGWWDGEWLLDPLLVDEMLEPSPANPAYGLGWWLDPTPDDETNPDAPQVPGDLVMAAGAGNQRLYVMRSSFVAVVRFSEDVTFEDAEFLSRLLHVPEG